MHFNQQFESKEQELRDLLKKQLRATSLELEDSRQQYKQLFDEHEELRQIHENNLNVIEEIENENQLIKSKATKMAKDYDTKVKYLQQTLSEQKIVIIKLQNDIERLNSKIRLLEEDRSRLAETLASTTRQSDSNKTQKLELKHKAQIQQLTQMAAQRLKNQEIQHQRAMNSLKTENEKLISDLRSTCDYLSQENRTANEQLANIKKQASQKELLLCQKIEKCERSLKEADYCKKLYEQELQNLKSSNETWEANLKERIRSLQSEKQHILQEFTDYKLRKKQKNRQIKEQYSAKIQEVVLEKSKAMKRYEDLVRDLKLQNEKTAFINQQLKRQVSDLEKGKKDEERQVSAKQQLLSKATEQNIRALKNEIQIRDIKIKDLSSQLNESLKTTSDLKIVVEKLRFTAETRNNEYQALKLQFNKFKNQARATKPKQVQQPQYSKYFSEDMGPIDQFWFDRKSGLKKEKDNILKDVYDNKQVEALQKQNAELKDVIGKMSRDMQDVRDNFLTKLQLKDREIKLGKDEIQMLREKINEKDGDYSKLRDKIMTLQVDKARLQEKYSHLKTIEETYKSTKEALEQMESELKRVRIEVEETYLSNQNLLSQREGLIQLSSQLKAQLVNLQEQLTKAEEHSKMDQNRSGNSVQNIGYSLNSLPQISQVRFDGRNERERHQNHQKRQLQERQEAPSKPQGTEKPIRKQAQTLSSLIRQRKSLASANRKPQNPDFILSADKAQLNQPIKQRLNQETESQKKVREDIRKKSQQRFDNLQ